MDLQEINKQLEQFSDLLSNLSNIDFVANLIDTSKLTDEEKEKLEAVKVDPSFLALIDKKASTEEIQEYIKTL